MPTLPPWIRPTEGVPYFLQGASIGSNIRAREVEAQAQRDRLALAQMEEQRRQEEAVQNAAMQMRKIEELKSFEREKMAADAADKARQYAAQQEYEDAIKSGADPITALSRLGPRMGVSPAPLITAMERAKQAATVEPFRVEKIGGKDYIITKDKSGREYPRPIPRSAEEIADTQSKADKAAVIKDELSELTRAKVRLDTTEPTATDAKTLADLKVKKFDALMKIERRIDALNKQLDAVRKSSKTETESVESSPYKEGQILINSDNGKRYVVRNGVPVLAE